MWIVHYSFLCVFELTFLFGVRFLVLFCVCRLKDTRSKSTRNKHITKHNKFITKTYCVWSYIVIRTACPGCVPYVTILFVCLVVLCLLFSCRQTFKTRTQQQQKQQQTQYTYAIILVLHSFSYMYFTLRS